jgi:hypothetical protein
LASGNPELVNFSMSVPPVKTIKAVPLVLAVRRDALKIKRQP